MKDIFTERRGLKPWVMLLPFLVFSAVLLLEYESSGLRVSPSLLTIALAIFAFFLSPYAVSMWAIIFFVPIVFSLWFVPNNGVYETPTFVVLRSAAYVTVAWIAVALSRYRIGSEERLRGLLSLFDSLKTPIVVSDSDGHVTFTNRAWCDLLGRIPTEIEEANFYSVFTEPDQRGRGIETYLKMFDLPMSKTIVTTIQPPGGSPSAQRKATCSTFRWDHRRFLVTQLDLA